MKQLKRCKECGKGIISKNKSGLCSHHYQKWYHKSPRGKFKMDQWLLKNREKVLKWKRDYYYRNKENFLKKQREYQKSEKGKIKRKKWKENNKEKVKEIGKRYYLKNRDKIIKKLRDSRKKKKLGNVTTLK